MEEDIIMTIKFYLKKKEELIPKQDKKEAQHIKEEINLISQKLQTLGYDRETISEVTHILLRPHGHSAILRETKHKERILLGEIVGEQKPTFSLTFEYESNLSSMKRWVEKQVKMNIIRVEAGKSEQVISFDEFAKEMNEHPWTSFGMPKKYNSNEETIWAYLR